MKNLLLLLVLFCGCCPAGCTPAGPVSEVGVLKRGYTFSGMHSGTVIQKIYAPESHFFEPRWIVLIQSGSRTDAIKTTDEVWTQLKIDEEVHYSLDPDKIFEVVE